jgi:hypothetical protein
MNSFLRLSGLAALALVLSASVASANDDAVSHESELTVPTADILADGNIVLSFSAGGNLSGPLTLTLRKDESGAYSGEWAMMVAHTDNTDPNTGVEPPPHDHPADDAHMAGHSHGSETEHRDHVRFMHRGSLAGTVTGAMVVFAAHGKITQIVAPLKINQGTLEFKQSQGSGQVTLAGLSLAF